MELFILGFLLGMAVTFAVAFVAIVQFYKKN
jgi:hypothetical protein